MTVYFTKIFELFDGLIEKRLQDRATVGSIRKNDVLDTLLDAREDEPGRGHFPHQALSLGLICCGNRHYFEHNRMGIVRATPQSREAL
ncbi:hypothetical protein NL676_011367 [Syzygium grande]|nr:hypothetical protein NL676_011367 [Syzygium grande]